MTGILPSQKIEERLEFDTNNNSTKVLINASSSQVQSASYDLRMGGEFYIYDEDSHFLNNTKISKLGRWRDNVQIPPNQAVMICIHEEIDFPDDIVGRLSLKFDYTALGLMMSAQSQIDAGYKGKIYALLQNLSSASVSISKESSILRLELFELSEPSLKAFDKPGVSSLAKVIKKPIFSSIGSLAKQQKKLNAKVNGIGLFFALSALVVNLIPYIGVMQQNDLKHTTAIASHERELKSLKDKNLALQKDINNLLKFRDKFQFYEFKTQLGEHSKIITNNKNNIIRNDNKIDTFHESQSFSK